MISVGGGGGGEFQFDLGNIGGSGDVSSIFIYSHWFHIPRTSPKAKQPLYSTVNSL